jgi:hypothetical protein
VDEELITTVENQFAKPDSPVHQLVPRPFEEQLLQFYQALGSPAIGRESAWKVYKDLLQAFIEWDEATDTSSLSGPGTRSRENVFASLGVQEAFDDIEHAHPLRMPADLLPGQGDLPYGFDQPVDDSGTFYLGGRPEGLQGVRDPVRSDDNEKDKEEDKELEEDGYEELHILRVEMSDED